MNLAIGKPVVNQDVLGISVEAELNYGGTSPVLWFRVPERYVPDPTTIGDAFVASMLPVAMARGENLTVDAPVSAKLLEGIQEIQTVLTGWYPTLLKRVKVTPEAAVTAAPSGVSRTISCFTGGVDSFHTFVRHVDEIDSLLYVDGFDVPLPNMPLLRTVHNTVNAAAAARGKEATFVATNLKSFTDKELSWSLVAHGAALAGVGMLLQSHFSTMLIPSSHSMTQLFPWGSHLHLDHLWSTERLAFIHDGADASRVQKTLVISTEPSAYNNLRVCWQNKGPYNCGDCDKCLRTMTTLELMGARDKFTVFPDRDLVSALRGLKIGSVSGMEFQAEVLEYAQQTGNTSPVVAALSDAIDRFKARCDPEVPAEPPFAGGRIRKQAELRKEAARLRAENARLKSQLNARYRGLPWRMRRRVGLLVRRVGRLVRRVVPRKGTASKRG